MEGNAHATDIPMEEEQVAMVGITSLVPTTHVWGSSVDLQRSADEHVREAWKLVFAPLAEPSMENRSVIGVVSLAPLDTTPITWQMPKEGIRVLDLFGGISTRLVAVLQAGILVHQYLYVERDEAATRASLNHVAQLRMRYPELLPMSAVWAYQHQMPGDISLLGAPDLERIGTIQGHVRVIRLLVLVVV